LLYRDFPIECIKKRPILSLRKCLKKKKSWILYESAAGFDKKRLNDKGKAIKILKKIYKGFFGSDIRTIALGDSLNDKPMLEAVDKAFLLEKPHKKFAKIKGKNIKRIKGVGPEGWNTAISEMFLDINLEKAEMLYEKSIKVLKDLQNREIINNLNFISKTEK